MTVSARLAPSVSGHRHYIRDLERAGFSARSHQVWFQMELAQPLFLAAMVLIAAGLPPRPAGMAEPEPWCCWRCWRGLAYSFCATLAGVSLTKQPDPGRFARRIPPLYATLLALGVRLTRTSRMADAAADPSLVLLAVCAGSGRETVPPDRTTLVADSVTVQSPAVASGHVEVFSCKNMRSRQRRHLRPRRQQADHYRADPCGGWQIRPVSGRSGRPFCRSDRRAAHFGTDGLLEPEAANGYRLKSYPHGGGRYTAMHGVVASSCTICEGSTTPLWEIRSQQVVHDELTHQIWFSNATAASIAYPVFLSAVLRTPDPTLARLQGFKPPICTRYARLVPD